MHENQRPRPTVRQVSNLAINRCEWRSVRAQSKPQKLTKSRNNSHGSRNNVASWHILVYK